MKHPGHQTDKFINDLIETEDRLRQARLHLRSSPPKFDLAISSLNGIAEAGCVRAQSLLGYLLCSISSVRDYDNGRSFLFRAARQGDPIAQLNLAVCYIHGHGCEEDLIQAQIWLRRSAHGGCANAFARLGAMYGSGEGVDEDEGLSARLLRVATDLGDPDAIKYIRRFGELQPDA